MLSTALLLKCAVLVIIVVIAVAKPAPIRFVLVLVVVVVAVVEVVVTLPCAAALTGMPEPPCVAHEEERNDHVAGPHR